ncbi:MAG: hypothetical protein FH751_12635 [Firmicutes bacterium]|nr:hypothetical protein [Bacillota bacterium]
MLLNKLIIETLKPLNIPVGFQKYKGKSNTYITFHEYLQIGEEFEEDQEFYTGHHIQIDVWSKEDYTELVNLVRNKLTTIGFKRISEEDLYEKDTCLYHKGMRFFYLEEKEVV